MCLNSYSQAKTGEQKKHVDAKYQAIVKRLISKDAKVRKKALVEAQNLPDKDRVALLQILEKSDDPELQYIAKQLKPVEMKDGKYITTASGLKYMIIRIVIPSI